jgi:DHA1 family bicyclomycin/chloramphenicol resistance-like MFS transporter
MHAPSSPSPRRASLGFLLLVGAMTAFGAISIDLYLPALAVLAVDFGVPAARMQQTMASFFVGMGLGQLAWGPLSDRLGRRAPLLAGCLLYTLASLAAAFSPSLEAMTAARFAQAIGASAGVVIARAVVRDRFDTLESARVFSLLFLVLGVAPLLAPLIGALLLEMAGWEWIFILLALFGAGLAVAVWRFLPETRSTATAAFARGESPLASYRAALGHRAVLGYVLAGAANGVGFFAYIGGAPLLFMAHFGLSAFQFSLAFAVTATGLILVTQLNRVLLGRFSPEALLVTGSAGAALCALLLLLLALGGAPGFLAFFALIFLAIGSYGMVAANSMALALSHMPTRAGTVSALIGAVSLGAGAISTFVGSRAGLPIPLLLALQMAVGFGLQLLFLLAVARPLAR